MDQDTINKLLAISKMRNDGQLTDEEFEALKKQLMQGDTRKSDTNLRQQSNTPKQPGKFSRMDRCDKFLAVSILIGLIVAVVIGTYCFIYDGQYKSAYVEPASIKSINLFANDDGSSDSGSANTDGSTNEEGSKSQSDETGNAKESESVNYDTQMSEDPDMDESTWCKVEKVDCRVCQGFGKCRACYGTGYLVIPEVAGTPKCTALYCNNGECTACGGTGKTTKKTYKDIAIGSSHWRYSKYDKRREAEKFMMRKMYILSNGASANPKNQYNYVQYKNGFKESFGNSTGIYLYSVYLCPNCKGKMCDKCLNGYVVTDCKITFNKILNFVNGKLVFAETTNPTSQESGSSRPQVTGSKQCRFCYGRGNTIMPAPYPYFGETEGEWYCSECRLNISKANFHHHRDCSNCRGDGQVDPGDPGYIGN